MAGASDTHQHLWPAELVDRLRSRTAPPCLRGWTLHLEGRPPQPIDPAHHDVAVRLDHDRCDGVDGTWLALDPSLVDQPDLVTAWLDGVGRLAPHFRAWVPGGDDLDRLATRLADGCVGVQLSATAVASPTGWERVEPLLAVAEAAGRPVLVHPGGSTGLATGGPAPAWWGPVVDDVAQLQAAWWAWHAAGVRARFGSLRVVFAGGAGLAPVLHERRTASGGGRLTVDPDLFVDTAGCGPQALDALVRVLGIDVLVAGSDRPHTEPLGSQVLDRALGDAATHAVRVANPARLLDGPPATTTRSRHPREERTWPRAS